LKALSNNIEISYTESGKQKLTFTLLQKQDVSDLKAICDKKKLIAIECKEHRNKRRFEAEIGSREEFRRIFGESYILED
jgi:hypothetical protein